MKFEVQHSTLLLVTLWGVNCQDGAAEPRKTKSVSGPADTNESIWVTSGIVTDLPLSEGYPPAELEVKYGNFVVSIGMTLKPGELRPTPPTSVRLKGDINCMPPFTLLMVDPDGRFTFDSTLHWLVINANSTERLHQGEEAVRYQAPTPEKRLRSHRIVFLAYCQGAKRLETKDMPAERSNFNLTNFVKQANLMGRPFGGTFFCAEHAQSVPSTCVIAAGP